MNTSPADPDPPGLRVLYGLFAAAVLVSIVHYVDNVINYAAYPEPTRGRRRRRESSRRRGLRSLPLAPLA